MRVRRVVLSSLIVLVMLTALVPASAGTISNSHTWGLRYEDGARATDIDGFGNVYIAGYTYDGSRTDGFLAKFDSTGQLVWDRTLEVDGYVSAYDIAVDDVGNTYVCGNVWLTGPGSSLGFVSKFSADGTLVFERFMEGFGSPWQIELDSKGFVVVGDWSGSTGIAAFTSTGSLRWAVNSFPNGSALAYGLAVDSSDNVIITIDRAETMSDVGYAKFDTNGNLVRQTLYKSWSPEEYSWDITIGSDGYIYGLGWSISENLLFLVKLTPTLDFVWGEKIGNPSSLQECWRIVGQPDGSVYAIGQAQDNNVGILSPALFHFTSSGSLVEASRYGIADFSDAVALPYGGFVLAGQAYSEVDLTPIPVPGIAVTSAEDMIVDDNVVYQNADPMLVSGAFVVGDPDAYVDSSDSSLGAQAWFGYVDAVIPQLQVSITVRDSHSNPNSFTFRGLATGGDRPYTYTWQFGDGTTEVGQRTTHVFASSGIYHVTLLAKDSAGKYGYAAVEVAIPGPPVVLGFDQYPTPALLNQPVSFVVDAYDPDGGALASYLWDFGDGTTSSSTSGVMNHTYSSVGMFSLAVAVIDDEGMSATGTWIVEVVEFNNPPMASFTVTPSSGNVSTVFTVDASSSSDSEDPASSLMVRWDWESDGYWDTNWTTDKISYHMFASPGTYWVSLEIMDIGGLKDNASQQVKVSSTDWTILLDENFDSWGTLDSSWSIWNATYLDFANWLDVQDGLLVASNNGVLAYDHYLSYANWTRPINYSGEFELSFRICLPLDCDEKYGWAGQVFWVIMYDTSGYAGLISRFVMDSPGDTNATGWVNWQGEVPVQICPFYSGWHEVSMRMSAASMVWTPTFDGVEYAPQMFRAPSGAFEIGKIAFVNALREEVQVCALDWVQVAASGTIITPNLPPVASFTVSPQYAYVDDSVTFDASASYDPDGTIVEWGWEYGDGTGGGGEVIAHPFNSSGTYTTTLTVWDDDGAMDTATATVVVLEVGERANWTFLVYDDGDNNLEDFALIDFLEMSSVGSTSEVNIVVQLDRCPYYDTSYGDWTGTKRFYVTQGMTPIASNALMDMGELNMGAPETLTSFLEWGMMTFPAENYMVVLWDHGGGWDGAVCWDETDGFDALTLNELQMALNMSEMDTGDWIDAVGFDACLMGMAEVAYEIRDCADVLVFSEETVPADGWPYNTIMADLVGNPTMSPLELAGSVVLRYSQFYGSNGSETMSVADVNALKMMLYPALDVFASELLASLSANKMEITESLNASERFGYLEYIDLYDFASEVSNRVPVATVQEAAEELMNVTATSIVANFAGSWHSDANGLSIYFPPSSSSSIQYYGDLNMSIDLMWDDFIRAFLVTEADSYEPDDTYLEANTILPGETQWHSIDDWGADVDWVTFTLTNVTQMRISTSGPEGMGDSVLRLYNESGAPSWPIAENDDCNNSLWSQITAWLGPGVYWVQVSAYDYEADIPSYGLTLTCGPFPNEPPVASWYWYGNPYVGSYLYFEGYGSFDPDGYIVNFTWDFGDGSFSSGSWASHMYLWAGDFMVTLTVMDDQGLMSNYSVWITISQGNVPPVALVVTTPQNPTVGELVTFDGSMSYDPDGYVTSWYWFFGDGYSSYGSVVYHSYSSQGTYTVELNVNDNNGLWNYTILWVTVSESIPVPPVAVIAYEPSQPMVGEPVMFDGNYSVDPDGYLTTYIWQFGDGDVGFGVDVAHAYEHPGTYMVSLSAIDNSGLSDETITTIRVVSMPIAAFAYSPLIPLSDQPTDFYAVGSYDESGIAEYIWSFGDGTYASGWQATHSFASPGNYSVTLTVRNANGLEANYSEVVTVTSAQLSTVAGASNQGGMEKLDGTPSMILVWMALLGICATGSGLVVRSRRP
jgi:PKD repeat protein